jgi:hypothetical protein
MTRSPNRPKQPAADLATASRGLPADWEILRDGTRVGHVLCPDSETALTLAVFRFGVGVSVASAGSLNPNHPSRGN